MKDLLEKLNKIEFAGEKKGQKPGEQWKGKDKGTPSTKLVGDGAMEESIIHELEQTNVENALERKLAEEFAAFAEDNFGVETPRKVREGSRPIRKKGDGFKQQVEEGPNGSEYGVRYKMFAGREQRLVTKEKFFKTAEQLERFCDKIREDGKFYEIDGFCYPQTDDTVVGEDSTSAYGPDEKLADLSKIDTRTLQSIHALHRHYGQKDPRSAESARRGAEELHKRGVYVPMDEHIVKVGNEYELKSHKGKNLGKYPTKAGAEKRERQVNYFKHVNEGAPIPNAEEGWCVVSQHGEMADGPYLDKSDAEKSRLRYYDDTYSIKFGKSTDKGYYIATRAVNPVNEGNVEEKLTFVNGDNVAIITNYGKRFVVKMTIDGVEEEPMYFSSLTRAEEAIEDYGFTFDHLTESAPNAPVTVDDILSSLRYGMQSINRHPESFTEHGLQSLRDVYEGLRHPLMKGDVEEFNDMWEYYSAHHPDAFDFLMDESGLDAEAVSGLGEGLVKNVKRFLTKKDAMSRANQELHKSHSQFTNKDSAGAAKHMRNFNRLNNLIDENDTPSSSGTYQNTVYPDNKQGVLQFIQNEVDQNFVGKELNPEECDIWPDPEVEGVWAVKNRNTGKGIIIYMGGYKNPWGDIRNSNDFEQAEFDNDLYEGWKSKMAGAALVGATATAVALTPPTTVNGQNYNYASAPAPVDAKVVVDDKGNKIKIWNGSRVKASPGSNGTKTYLYRPIETANEGWESGPEERPSRERDPDAWKNDEDRPRLNDKPVTVIKYNRDKPNTVTTEPVKESTDGSVISQIKNILNTGYGSVKFSDGKLKVDTFTASAIKSVYDHLSPNAQAKANTMLETKAGFHKFATFAFKHCNVREDQLTESQVVSDIEGKINTLKQQILNIYNSEQQSKQLSENDNNFEPLVITIRDALLEVMNNLDRDSFWRGLKGLATRYGNDMITKAFRDARDSIHNTKAELAPDTLSEYDYGIQVPDSAKSKQPKSSNVKPTVDDSDDELNQMMNSPQALALHKHLAAKREIREFEEFVSNESRGHKIIATKLDQIANRGKIHIPSPQERAEQEKAKKEQEKQQSVKEGSPSSQVGVPVTPATPGSSQTSDIKAATSPQGTTAQSTVDPKIAQMAATATNTIKSATQAPVSSAQLAQSIDAASLGNAVSQRDAKNLQPVLDVVDAASKDPSLANQFRQLASGAQKYQQQQQKPN